MSMPENDQGPWWEAQALALSAEAERRERRRGTALIIGSVVLMAVSLLCMFIGSLGLIGLVCLVFFGACLLAGILMRGDPNSRTTFVLSLWAALLMGLGMGLLFIFTLVSALTHGASGNQIVVLVVAAIGFLFFGVGCVAAMVKASRTGRQARGRQARDQWQNRRPRRRTQR
ncbi:MAG: hypothetical protein L0I80_03635 [Brevibacterium sp.]|nr:hypothetical protein [Brevibacterium sp.]MDN6122951.1 hypothetical protein [Brevibacterium sp.]MDN6527702.1 hypothetical protein [Brevibacterium sp.]MDN6603833.1 hypothetical protein [Brevibacterium sp.]MDN6666226.1 hypothetical protein [Brevibacterium sp.]